MNSLELSALADKAAYFHQTENPEKAYLFARFAAFTAAKTIAGKSHKNAAEAAATVAVSKELLKTFVALQFSVSFSEQAKSEDNLTGQYLRQDLIHVETIDKTNQETLASKAVNFQRDNINALIKQLEQDYFNQFSATDKKNRFALQDAVHLYPVAFASALTAFVEAEKTISHIKNPIHRQEKFKDLIQQRLRHELQDKTPSNWRAIHYTVAAGCAVSALLVLAGCGIIAMPFLGLTILPAAGLYAAGALTAVAGAGLGITGTGVLAHGLFSTKLSPQIQRPHTDKTDSLNPTHS